MTAVALAGFLLGCGDSTSDTTPGDTSTSTSTGTGGSGGTGGTPTTTVREVSLTDLGAGQTSFELPPTALGALFWLRSEDTYALALEKGGQSIIEESRWMRGGARSVIAVVGQLDYKSTAWTLPSGHGDPLSTLGGTYGLKASEPEQMGAVSAISASSTGAGGPRVFDPAVVRIREGVFTRGAIDFNVFLPAGLDREAHMKQVLTQVMSDFGGLSLGAVDFYPLPEAGLVLDSEAEVATLQQELTIVTKAPSVSIIVTTAFSPEGFMSGAQLKGRSPLPGQPFAHGTSFDSLLMRVSDDPAYDAIVVRHELGHFAGLYHTEETIPNVTDAFDDTPDCPSFPEMCFDPMCGCDMSNLMFPVVADATPRTLSEQQKKLLQGSLVYRDDGKITAQRQDVAATPSRFVDATRGLSATAVNAAFAICDQVAAPALSTGDRRDLLAVAERTDASPAVRRAAVEALRTPRNQDERDRVLALAASPAVPRDVRLGAVAVLGGDADDEARGLMGTLLEDDDAIVRAAAAAASKHARD